MNNCCLDFKTLVKIPQNSTSFFQIKCDERWKYTIEIKFSIEEEIDYLNLFLIIKSYVYNEVCLAYAIGTSFQDVNSKRIVTENENIKKIRKMDFLYFCEWINFRITKDSEYEKKDSFYSILIMFEQSIVVIKNTEMNLKVLEILKPVYPWTPQWLNFFDKNVEETLILKKKIQYYENLKNKKKYPISLISFFITAALFLFFVWISK